MAREKRKAYTCGMETSFPLQTYLKVTVFLAAAGTVFAGYLSGYKIFYQQCAFSEPCPYFLGYPACWYGFGLFTILFILSLISLITQNRARWALRAVHFTAIIGIIFAGSFVWQELMAWLSAGRSYQLLLPTCVYGLIFYILIFFLSGVTLIRTRA